MILIDIVIRLLFQMFNLKLFKKKPKYFSPDCIFESSFMDSEKWKHLKGEITIRHCRGHHKILILFDFKGFYQQHVLLLSRNYHFD